MNSVPVEAPVPAEDTVIWSSLRAVTAARVIASAIGLRQVLPVQTKRMCMIGIKGR